ncbi:MAG: hypothetical protein WC003_16100 [Terrimicrobiaceae bacterium]
MNHIIPSSDPLNSLNRKTPSLKLSLCIKSIGLVLAIAAMPQAALATSQIWDGGSLTDGDWSTAINWSEDTTPPSNNQSATFNAAIANTWGNSAANPITLNAARVVRFISVTGSSDSYFIGTSGGNALTMAASGANGGLWQMDSSLATSPVFTIRSRPEIT